MDALEAILSRRTVKAFKPITVSENLITQLLQAAMAAPSAANQQPWHFVVVTSRQVLDAIPKYYPYADVLHEAQAAILVCGDISLQIHRGSWIVDCAAATENILLAAHAQGLGGVWVGFKPDDEPVRSLFDLPSQVIPFSIVAVGYPSEHIDNVQRFDASRIHYENWLSLPHPSDLLNKG